MKKPGRATDKWSRLGKGCVKLNFDVATNPRQYGYGIGVVARDSNGCVLLAAAKFQHPLIEAELAEIKAAEWAVNLAKSQGWRDITIEGDAALVIEALKKTKKRGLHAQVLIDNICLNLSDLNSA